MSVFLLELPAEATNKMPLVLALFIAESSEAE